MTLAYLRFCYTIKRKCYDRKTCWLSCRWNVHIAEHSSCGQAGLVDLRWAVKRLNLDNGSSDLPATDVGAVALDDQSIHVSSTNNGDQWHWPTITSVEVGALQLLVLRVNPVQFAAQNVRCQRYSRSDRMLLYQVCCRISKRQYQVIKLVCY